MDYNLVDIHFHSNLSYDGFENRGTDGQTFDIRNIFKDSNVKMVCITDHNVFDFEKYISNSQALTSIGIKCLAGIELTIDGVHWIVIIDDNKLLENSIGEKFTNDLLSLIGFNKDNLVLSELKSKSFEIDKIITLMNKYEINFIAIPHLDKQKGLLKNGSISEENLELFCNYIYNNIVFGFETKYHDEFFIKRIKEINKNIKILENDSPDLNKLELLYNQIREVEKMRSLTSAFVFGSDFHGKINENYKEKESILFYIKSECSFDGLRFALLDYESRIFSQDRKIKYSKETNKVLEYIRYSINGEERKLKFGDGLNSIIGSRGTGKSYIIKTILGKNINYKDSDIYNQIKILGIKLKGESEQSSLNQNIDVDYIFQKSSTEQNSENIYDLLSEAPYDTEKFVDKIRKLSTETKTQKGIDSFFENANQCLKLYIDINKLKNEQLDYILFSKYNVFYNSVGVNYKVVEILNNYNSFVQKFVEKYNKEIEKLQEFNEKLENLKIYIEFAKELKGYDYTEFKQFENEIGKIKIANNLKIEKNNKNLLRILKTEKFVKCLLFTSTSSITNEEKNYNTAFDGISNKIEKLLVKMSAAKTKSTEIQKIINAPVVNDEILYIRKNDKEIGLLINQNLDVKNTKIKDAQDIFKNYTKIDTIDEPISFLFENFYGQNFIDKIYEKKDMRFTRGILDGFEIYMPKLIPSISIKINEENKDLSKMSPGQKSDILLDLILDQNSNKLLIIDQPEDDLDNETIYNKVVAKIRKLKLRRQIIIVSHNANLVINGDSDQIIICYKNKNDYNIIQDSMESINKYKYVSINCPEADDTILNIAVQILEGGRVALSKRVKKIGYKDIFLKEIK